MTTGMKFKELPDSKEVYILLIKLVFNHFELPCLEF